MKRLATLLCVCVLPLGAAACAGSATVNSDDVSATAVATGSNTPDNGDGSTTAPATQAHGGKQAEQDGGPARLADDRAQEVDSIPVQEPHYSAEEQAFLTELKESGLNIKGIEDQLTATGMSVCSDESITRDAVAGQLVEQRRTDMDPDALGQLLTDSARAHLC